MKEPSEFLQERGKAEAMLSLPEQTTTTFSSKSDFLRSLHGVYFTFELLSVRNEMTDKITQAMESANDIFVKKGS